MKSFLSVLFAGLAILLMACQLTPRKAASNTLISLGQTGNSAYESYLLSVASGAVATNDVPSITRVYRQFQAAYGLAFDAWLLATNQVPQVSTVESALSDLQSAIALVKSNK